MELLCQLHKQGVCHAEIIRALVERIDVFKPEKVPGTRMKKQTILIHRNFIGAVDLPQEQKKIGIAGFLQTMPTFFQGIKSLSVTPLRRGCFLFMKAGSALTPHPRE